MNIILVLFCQIPVFSPQNEMDVKLSMAFTILKGVYKMYFLPYCHNVRKTIPEWEHLSLNSGGGGGGSYGAPVPISPLKFYERPTPTEGPHSCKLICRVQSHLIVPSRERELHNSH